MKENDLKELQKAANDEISIIDILLTLWKKRVIIILWSIIFAVIIVAVSGVVFLRQTKYQTSELSFSLDFKGVSLGQYPNGSRFSTNDIISIPVLRKVYKDNSLEKYFSDFNEFQNTLSVYRYDFRLTILRAEYAGKLSEKKLTVEDRDKLEQEFKRKQEDILSNSDFNLVMTAQNKLKQLPSELTNKVLRDILKIWLNNAEKDKGINRYKISLVTNNVISKSDIENLDYIVGIDLLRETISKLKSDIEKVSKLPGGKTIRIQSDNTETSLADIEFKVNFLDTYELQPLIGAIRTYGITKEGPLSVIYLKTKLYQLERDQIAIMASRKVYANSLNEYQNDINQISDGSIPVKKSSGGATIIPQFDGTFFDKIVSMAQQDANTIYRQDLNDKEISTALKSISLNKEIDYYKTLSDAFDKFKKEKQNSKDLTTAENFIKEQQLKIYNSVIDLIRQNHEFYNKINEYTLNLQSQYYNINSFTVKTTSTLSVKKVIIVMILLWVLLEVVLIVGVLLGNKMSEDRK